jgi:hypothetical protein
MEYVYIERCSQWLAPLLRIREVPGLDIESETGYPAWYFLWFSSRKMPESYLN